MAYIVGVGCIQCEHATCMDVCPVDAFRKNSGCLEINADLCISCGSCESECSFDAIFSNEGVTIRAGNIY